MRLRFDCAWCGVYCREERFDGYKHYTVCSYCGRSELRIESQLTEVALVEDRSGTEQAQS